MNGLSSLLFLYPLAVMLACIAFSVLVVREFARATGKPSAWRQVSILAVTTFLFSGLGAMFVSGQSGMPIIVMGAAPCVFFLVVGAAFPRVVAAALLLGWIAFGVLDYHDTKRREEWMRARYEERRRAERQEQAEREQDREEKQPEPGVGADSR